MRPAAGRRGYAWRLHTTRPLTTVATGPDGKLMAFFSRVAPRTGHFLLGAVYRKIGDPKLFARLRQLVERHHVGAGEPEVHDLAPVEEVFEAVKVREQLCVAERGQIHSLE